MSRLVDDFADWVIQLKLKAVISCQHAVRDNRDDSQFRLTRVIEVVGRSWLKRVFSRPGPLEPEEGLPGLDEETPNGRSKGKVACPCGKQWGPIRLPKVVKDGRRVQRRPIGTPKAVKENHCVLRRSLRSPEAVKDGNRVQRRANRSPKAAKDGRRVLEKANRSPKAVKEGRREQSRSLRSPKGKEEGLCEQGRPSCSPGL